MWDALTVQANFHVGWLAGSDTWDVTRVQVNVVWHVENVSGARDGRAVRVAIGDRAAKQFEMTHGFSRRPAAKLNLLLTMDTL
jgi:hypothetical protein